MTVNIFFAALKHNISYKLLWVDLNPVIDPNKIIVLAVLVSWIFMRKLYALRDSV